MMIAETCASQIRSHLEIIYGECNDSLLTAICERIEKYRSPDESLSERWSERDIGLITYGDQVSQPGKPTLETLKQFLLDHDLQDAFSFVHILPFCPYSSDDGFSVIDYRKIDPNLGDWEQVAELGEQVDLMFDLVLNHISQHSDWFQAYLKGDPAYAGWFIEVEPGTDVSQVTRPRSHPLLTPYETPSGTKHIWTTFSADQIDLNFANPAVMLEILDTLLLYAQRGARIIRLDAIAFLWKEIGTTCLHLKQTHEAVKLFRTVLAAAVPKTLVLTETNVPHKENVSYFGDGDEAHLIYNFSLPPLLYDAYVNQEATPLRSWLSQWDTPQPGATWFNFTASHDGIGVRPLEGLVEEERFNRLVEATRERGGLVSMREMPDGRLSPYELNISWSSAMHLPGDDPWYVQRVLASQAFMMSLQGIPATYFHSLVGTPNDAEAAETSGIHRRINRRKYEYDELSEILKGDSGQAEIFAGYRRLMAIRREQPAFHPDASQTYLETADPAIAAFERVSTGGEQTIIVVANFTDASVNATIPINSRPTGCQDLISGVTFELPGIELKPNQILWLQMNND